MRTGRPRQYIKILTKEYLTKNYVNSSATLKDIANILNLDRQTVTNYVKYFGLKIKPSSVVQLGKSIKSKHDKLITKRYLIKHYLFLQESIFKIKKHFNVNNSIITRYLKKYNIPMRSKEEVYKLNSGKNCYRFGMKNSFNYIGKYNNIYMRSFWELNFAKWLDLSGIKWEYESKTFDLGNTTYTPDFYLPEFDCYIEIKGYSMDIFKQKIKLFNKLYKNINLQVFYKKDLQQFGIIK